jgi:Ca2+-binding RTX toxin-like protein
MKTPTPFSAPQALDAAALDRVTGGAKMSLGEPSVDGDQVIEGTMVGEMLQGGDGQDTILGQGGDDQIVGGFGADHIEAGSGDDTVIWSPGQGSDTIDGGSGSDTLLVNIRGLSLDALLNAIQTAPGSAAPSIQGGTINLAGVTGTLVIGDERISFSNLETLRLTGK